MPEFEKLPEGYSIDRRIEDSRTAQQQQEGAGYEALPQGYRLPGTEPTAYEKDYAAMPWSEVASSAAKEAIPSFGRALKAIPEAVINYEETGQALKQAGQGIASKVRGAFGEKQDPAQKAETEGIINAMMEPFTSMAGFKKALATDPFSVLSTAAIPVTGGAAGLAKGAQLAGTATTAGKALSGLSKAAGTTATLMDPVSTTMAAGKLVGEKVLAPGAKATASEISGLAPNQMELAYQAGKTKEPAIKDAFNTYASGKGDPVDLSQSTSKALKDLKSDFIDDWRTGKEAMIASQKGIPFDEVDRAIQEARNTIGPRASARKNGLAAHAELDAIENDIAKLKAMPPGSFENTLGGFDQLKRELWQEQKGAPNDMAQTAIKQVHAGVSQALRDTAPEYAKHMDQYMYMLDNMNNIQRTLGATDKMAATREMTKLIKAQNDATNNQLIQQLAKYDPTIPYKVAGAAIHQAAGHPSNWSNAFTLSQLANLAWGFQRGDPIHMMGAAAAMAGKRLYGTPQKVGEMAYGAGKYSGSETAKALEAAAPTADIIRRAAQGPLQRTQDEELMEQFRPQRASGGRVSDKLVTMVDRARKNINNQTESLLSTHDNHVARALEIANQNLEG
jgi:hypothetical protein